jgi:hypothetical protein
MTCYHHASTHVYIQATTTRMSERKWPASKIRPTCFGRVSSYLALSFRLPSFLLSHTFTELRLVHLLFYLYMHPRPDFLLP